MKIFRKAKTKNLIALLTLFAVFTAASCDIANAIRGDSTESPADNTLTLRYRDVAMSVAGALIDENHDGEPVITLFMDIDNTSKESIIPADLLMLTASQAGSELEIEAGWATELYERETMNIYRRILPGGLLRCAFSFILVNTDDPVSCLFGDDDGRFEVRVAELTESVSSNLTGRAIDPENTLALFVSGEKTGEVFDLKDGGVYTLEIAGHEYHAQTGILEVGYTFSFDEAAMDAQTAASWHFDFAAFQDGIQLSEINVPESAEYLNRFERIVKGKSLNIAVYYQTLPESSSGIAYVAGLKDSLYNGQTCIGSIYPLQ